MKMKILSAVMALALFMGGYAVLPEKYNPLPVNNAYCATNYGGLYYVNETFYVNYGSYCYYDQYGCLTIVSKGYYTYRAGTYIALTTNGYDSTKNVDLKPFIGDELSFIRR